MTKRYNHGQIRPEELIWIQQGDNKITVFKLNEFIVWGFYRAEKEDSVDIRIAQRIIVMPKTFQYKAVMSYNVAFCVRLGKS